MRDEHPMLVLSTKAFNDRAGIVIGLPMTPAASHETNPFAIKLRAWIGPPRESTERARQVLDLTQQVPGCAAAVGSARGRGARSCRTGVQSGSPTAVEAVKR
jgi:hypothetical protein